MGKERKGRYKDGIYKGRKKSLPRATVRRENGTGTTLPMDIRMIKCKSNVGLQLQVTVFLLKVRVF